MIPDQPIVNGYDFYHDDGGSWKKLSRESSALIFAISVSCMALILSIAAIVDAYARQP